MVMITALCWLGGVLLLLAQDWIVNWDPKAYQNLQGKPFQEPVRLKHLPGYWWGMGVTWGGPIVFVLIRVLIRWLWG